MGIIRRGKSALEQYHRKTVKSVVLHVSLVYISQL